MDKHTERTVAVRIFGLSVFTIQSQQTRRRGHPPAQDRGELEGVRTDAGSDGESPLFVVNSRMLHECFRKLTRTEEEDLAIVTGSCVGRIRTLERVVPVVLAEQNAVGATVDNRSLADGLIELYEFGMKPLGLLHSHPGTGPGATHPSGTDLRTQSSLEDAGAEIASAIFSRDGFIRFYGNGGVPNVSVVGRKIHKIDESLYQLEIEEDLRN